MAPQWSLGDPFQASSQATPFPVRFRKPNPHESVYAYIESGHDEFPEEKRAEEITALLHRAIENRSFPLMVGFQGRPIPIRYTTIESDSRTLTVIRTAVPDDSPRPFAQSVQQWIDSLGQIRALRFYVTKIELDSEHAKVRVRFEIASRSQQEIHYRVGQWSQAWAGDRLSRFEPLEETLVSASKPLFSDVTQEFLGNGDSFQQLRFGIPYWRARLDSASGIDVFGNNGIAVGDIDSDGRDEIYV